MFIVFWNDYDMPERAIILTKDAKNMTDVAESRRYKVLPFAWVSS